LKVLLTGAFGNVGLSTLKELLERGHEVRIFELKTSKNKRLARKYAREAELFWGDLRNIEDCKEAVRGQDVVIHVAAIIPPLADHKPKLAEAVNVGGTRNLVQAITALKQKTKIIFTSSIAIYGDRRHDPNIKVNDPVRPSPKDEYARQKIRAEEIIRSSGLEWAIFRLSYIVSVDKLQMDPIMFEMPLDTSIEIAHTRDVGLALSKAVTNPEIWGNIYHIAGGERCRTTYRKYLERMVNIFGVGTLPEDAFSTEPFHCGFMDTSSSQRSLQYQRHTLEDFYKETEKKVGIQRFFTKMFSPIAKKYVLAKSPYYKNPKGHGN